MHINPDEDFSQSIIYMMEALETLQQELERDQAELDQDFLSQTEGHTVEKITQQWVEKVEKYMARKNLLEYYRWELGFDLYFQLKQIGRENDQMNDDPILEIALSIFKEDAEKFFYLHRN